jgi:hypothetical protein
VTWAGALAPPARGRNAVLAPATGGFTAPIRAFRAPGGPSGRNALTNAAYRGMFKESSQSTRGAPRGAGFVVVVRRRPGSSPPVIRAVAASRALPSLVMLDASGQPLCHAYHLMDRRATAEVAWLKETIGRGSTDRGGGHHPSRVFTGSLAALVRRAG